MFLWLIFAHVIGDIALQGEFLAMNKGKIWWCMLWHSIIWAGCICFALEYLGIPTPLWKWIFLIGLHYTIDEWKCKSTKEFLSWHLWVDQGLHMIQCLIVFIG